jgi:hypothetical protein
MVEITGLFDPQEINYPGELEKLIAELKDMDQSDSSVQAALAGAETRLASMKLFEATTTHATARQPVSG